MNEAKSRRAIGDRRARRAVRTAAPLARLAGLAGIAMAVTLWLIPPEPARQSPHPTFPRPGRVLDTGASGERGAADGRDGTHTSLDPVADRAAGQDRRRFVHPPLAAEIFDEEDASELTVMQLGTLALTAREAALREAAVLALGERDGHPAIQALSQTMSDADQEVREAAVVALSQIGGAMAVQTLSEVLQWSMYAQDAPLRVVAVDALGLMGGPGAIAPLKRALADPDARVRAAAADALAELGATAAPRALHVPTVDVHGDGALDARRIGLDGGH